MRTAIERRAIVPIVVCLSMLAPGFAAQDDTQPDPAPQAKTRRAVVLRFDIASLGGGEGMMVALDQLAEAGKTATFQKTHGARLAAEVEIVRGGGAEPGVGAWRLAGLVDGIGDYRTLTPNSHFERLTYPQKQAR